MRKRKSEKAGGNYETDGNFIFLVLILGIVFMALKPRASQTEREKNAHRRSLIAYLLTNSVLVSWLVYKRNTPKDRL